MSNQPLVKRSSWPRLLRRGLLENIATGLIGLGFVMLFQPFALSLYTYSFITMLVGTVMFIVVSKLPE
jgi:uncharacterized membrane protein YeaQ/YmgE (transglycosylase-associated protein family)